MDEFIIFTAIIYTLINFILVILFIKMSNDVRVIKRKVKDEDIVGLLKRLNKNLHIKSIDDFILLAIINMKNKKIIEAKENIFTAKYLIENDVNIKNKDEYNSQINDIEKLINAQEDIL